MLLYGKLNSHFIIHLTLTTWAKVTVSCWARVTERTFSNSLSWSNESPTASNKLISARSRLSRVFGDIRSPLVKWTKCVSGVSSSFSNFSGVKRCKRKYIMQVYWFRNKQYHNWLKFLNFSREFKNVIDLYIHIWMEWGLTNLYKIKER